MSKGPHGQRGRRIIHGYVHVYFPEHPEADKQGYVNEHRLIAEMALCKPLPEKAEVHHVNGTRDSGPLVICQDRAYRWLLHQRTRALKVCGHANWRKCYYCKKYDSPEKLYVPKKPEQAARHRSCHAHYEKVRLCQVTV